jgi:U4/U6 small nuclear ribonucleoprotein PRP31
MRKMKERLAMTDLRKAQNRVTFDPSAGEYGDSAMGVDTLSSGMKDSQRLRAPRKVESQFLKKAKLKAVSASSGQTSGLSSSLVFTPVQGLELVNPNAAQDKVLEANRKWFSAQSGFLSAKPKAN